MGEQLYGITVLQWAPYQCKGAYCSSPQIDGKFYWSDFCAFDDK